MRGRKPIPTALKLVAGNPGKRALPTNEPKPEAALLEAPDYLGEDARVEWLRAAPALYRCGLLSVVDRPVFEAYCDAYGRFREAERVMAAISARDESTRGIVLRTTNGNPIINPVLCQLRAARNDMVRYATEFGMSPSARSRIDAGIPPDGGRPEGPESKFFGT